jgi:serine/threonine protein phosphatase 1
MNILDILRGRKPEAHYPPRERLSFTSGPAVIYAVGDVHGHLAHLRRLEQAIFADAEGISGDKWLLMLGDYIDRGPESAQVLDHLMVRPAAPSFTRYCIAGNHEIAMLAFLENPARNSDWLDFGGFDTLASYGIEQERLSAIRRGSRKMQYLIESHVPDEHRQFLFSLPILIQTPEFIFSHAGLRPGVALDKQHDDDLTWTRHDLGHPYSEFGKTVVHGHVPVEQPLILWHRLDVDTGVYLSGRLTAAKLAKGHRPQLLFVGGDPRDDPHRGDADS